MIKYKIFYQENNKLLSRKVYENELRNYDIIKKKKLSKDFFVFFKKIPSMFSFSKKVRTLLLIKEISSMLESNLSFEESIEILLKHSKNKADTKILETIARSLESGEKISKSLMKFKKDLDKNTILFFKLAEESSDFKGVLKLFAKHLDNVAFLKQKIKKALAYPVFLLFSLFLCFFGVFSFVLPNFENLFSNLGAKLPFATHMLLSLKQHFFMLFMSLIVVFIALFIIYKYIKRFKKVTYNIDKILCLKIPYFSKIFRFYYLYLFFMKMDIFLKNKYTFQDGLKKSLEVVENKFLYEKLSKLRKEVKNGSSVYLAFCQADIFDEITLRHILLAQSTSAFKKPIKNIQKNYKKILLTKVETFISFIEPSFFIVISLLILWLIIGLFLPLWNFGSLISA